MAGRILDATEAILFYFFTKFGFKIKVSYQGKSPRWQILIKQIKEF